METSDCILCKSGKKKYLFSKASRGGETFRLVRCRDCGLEYVDPRPDEREIGACYGSDYFSTRDDRGYNNYFSDEVRGEVERVFELNLRDLGFFEFEKNLSGPRRCLDVGCAAGYFVAMMDGRGWDASGIDVSEPCIDAAQKSGLSVMRGSYLQQQYESPFDMITLWATIEHLHHPEFFIRKIYRDLAEGGMLFISTCRTGGLNFKQLKGAKWRFYNFPEHLCFFSIKNIHRLLKQEGFTVTVTKTYGSGIGAGKSLLRRGADYAAKHWGLGDMMIVAARK